MQETNQNGPSGFDKHFSDPVAAQLSTGGRSRGLASGDDKIICLTELGTLDVDNYYASGCRIDAVKFKKSLEEEGWICRKATTNLYFELEEKFSDTVIEIWIQREKKLYMSMTTNSLYVKNTHTMQIGDETHILELGSDTKQLKHPIIASWELYGPVNLRESLKEYTEILFNRMKELHDIPSKESVIGIISHDGNGYYVKSFSLAGKIPQFIHIDEHYGEGFNDFHTKMLNRINTETKGLILFHGEPGTGKTQYIRMLLDQLTRTNKSILYVPPGFSDQLTDPMMIEFISEWIWEEDRDCILLIEDAEPLLESRNGADGRSTGISNLLNMTDGILNDMLGLMVIATFNTSISKIDSALLRPQRLIARKEFGRLTETKAKELATALEIELPEIEYPATLAEFYANKKGHDVLIHTVTQERKIGFAK